MIPKFSNTSELCLITFQRTSAAPAFCRTVWFCSKSWAFEWNKDKNHQTKDLRLESRRKKRGDSKDKRKRWLFHEQKGKWREVPSLRNPWRRPNAIVDCFPDSCNIDKMRGIAPTSTRSFWNFGLEIATAAITKHFNWPARVPHLPIEVAIGINAGSSAFKSWGIPKKLSTKWKIWQNYYYF